MGAIPADIETDTQPPLTVPLRHFLVGLAFLVAAGVVWTLSQSGLLPGLTRVAYTHLLVLGWVCVTIMGAMTQFVPVWSGVTLYDERLAAAQLWLVTLGVAGMVALLLVGPLPLLAAPGALVLAGLLVFVYNVARTLARAGALDVTERHFAVALAWFVVVPVLGSVLAVGYAAPSLLGGLPVTRANVLLAHATAAVFGAVVTTAIGAIYQLAQMFTQTDCSPLDRRLQRAETVVYPLGVAGLVAGRLLGIPVLARVGAVLALGGLAAAVIVVGHRLLDAQVESTPMLTRYAVVVLTTLSWVGLTAPAWVADPLSYTALLGPGAARTLLLAGVLGFLVVGTLYHVVPFIVWFHRYSDRLGLEAVPMIDDLYDDRLAVADFWGLAGGATLLTLSAAGVLPPVAHLAGGALLTAAVVVFSANMLLVIRGHSPYSTAEILGTGWLARARE